MSDLSHPVEVRLQDTSGRQPRLSDKALMELRRYKLSLSLEIPRLAFQKLVRAITLPMNRDLKFTFASLEALQMGAEV